MQWPWVSRRAYEVMEGALDRALSDRDEVRVELEKERAANRNLMASLLATKHIENPFHPKNLPAPPVVPTKKRADQILREMEVADRKAAQEMRDATARTTADAAGH